MPPVDLRARPGAAAPAADPAPQSPRALRLRRPGWRDPRLAVGLLLVTVSTVAGARLFATSDDAMTVWATGAPVQAGEPSGAAGLVPSRVELPAAADDAYLRADRVPAGVFTRDLGAGELVPATAIEPPGATDRADLALAVEAGAAPVDLSAGDLVDVWSVPNPTAVGSGAPTTTEAERVLAEVAVTVVERGSTFGAAGRQVVVRVDDARSRLGEVLGLLAGGTVVLVRVGG